MPGRNIVLLTGEDEPEEVAAAAYDLSGAPANERTILVYVDGSIGHQPITLSTLDWLSRLFAAVGWVHPELSVIPLFPVLGWSTGGWGSAGGL